MHDRIIGIRVAKESTEEGTQLGVYSFGSESNKNELTFLTANLVSRFADICHEVEEFVKRREAEFPDVAASIHLRFQTLDGRGLAKQFTRVLMYTDRVGHKEHGLLEDIMCELADDIRRYVLVREHDERSYVPSRIGIS